jgi:hypothetical protein
MQSFVSEGVSYSYDGELDEFTDVVVQRPGQDATVVPFGRLVALTNGAILEDVP